MKPRPTIVGSSWPAWRVPATVLIVVSVGSLSAACESLFLIGAVAECRATNPATTLPDAVSLRDPLEFKTTNYTVRLTHLGVKAMESDLCEANAVVALNEDAAARHERLTPKERDTRRDREDVLRFVAAQTRAQVGSSCNVHRIGLATDLGTWPRPKRVDDRPRVFTAAADRRWEPGPVGNCAPL